MLTRFIPEAGERRRFRQWALVALALHVAAGVCSTGWMAADEHWQVIEFASTFLGRTPASELPWEYAARERQALQPVLSAALEWPLIQLGVQDTFVLAAAVRVAGAVFAWAGLMLLALACLSWFPTSPARRWVAPVAALSWFLPFIHARTSSENAAEAAFLLGFAWLALQARAPPSGVGLTARHLPPSPHTGRVAADVSAQIQLGGSDFLDAERENNAKRQSLRGGSGSRTSNAALPVRGEGGRWRAVSPTPDGGALLVDLAPSEALAIGLLFGLAFEFRFQVGIMVAGTLLWCLVYRRLQLPTLIAMLIGIAGAVALGSVADRLFYSEWTFVPWTYFRTQVIEHRAADFGALPWWAYFEKLIEKAGPPLSVLLLGGTLWGWIRHPRSPFTWAMVPFVGVHLLMAHKELRFLDPVASLAVMLTLRSVDDARQRWPQIASSRWIRVVVVLLIVQDVAMLAVGTFTPARAAMPIVREIYGHVPTPAVLYWRGNESPYTDPGGLIMRFYVPQGLTLKSVTDYHALDQNLGAGDSWYVEPRAHLAAEAGALADQCKVEATTLPEWVHHFDVNGWVERTPAWTLYRCRRVDLVARHR